MNDLEYFGSDPEPGKIDISPILLAAATCWGPAEADSGSPGPVRAELPVLKIFAEQRLESNDKPNQQSAENVGTFVADLRQLALHFGDNSTKNDVLDKTGELMQIWKGSSLKIQTERSRQKVNSPFVDAVDVDELVFRRSQDGAKEELRINVKTGDATALRMNKRTELMEPVDAAVSINRMSQVLRTTGALKSLRDDGDKGACEKALRSVLDDAHRRNGMNGVREAISDIYNESDTLKMNPLKFPKAQESIKDISRDANLSKLATAGYDIARDIARTSTIVGFTSDLTDDQIEFRGAVLQDVMRRKQNEIDNRVQVWSKDSEVMFEYKPDYWLKQKSK